MVELLIYLPVILVIITIFLLTQFEEDDGGKLYYTIWPFLILFIPVINIFWFLYTISVLFSDYKFRKNTILYFIFCYQFRI